MNGDLDTDSPRDIVLSPAAHSGSFAPTAHTARAGARGGGNRSSGNLNASSMSKRPRDSSRMRVCPRLHCLQQ